MPMKYGIAYDYVISKYYTEGWSSILRVEKIWEDRLSKLSWIKWNCVKELSPDTYFFIYSVPLNSLLIFSEHRRTYRFLSREIYPSKEIELFPTGFYKVDPQRTSLFMAIDKQILVCPTSFPFSTYLHHFNAIFVRFLQPRKECELDKRVIVALQKEEKINQYDFVRGRVCVVNIVHKSLQ